MVSYKSLCYAQIKISSLEETAENIKLEDNNKTNEFEDPIKLNGSGGKLIIVAPAY